MTTVSTILAVPAALFALLLVAVAISMGINHPLAGVNLALGIALPLSCVVSPTLAWGNFRKGHVREARLFAWLPFGVLGLVLGAWLLSLNWLSLLLALIP